MKKSKPKNRKKGKASPLRRRLRLAAVSFAALALGIATLGDWYVHRPGSRVFARDAAPGFFDAALFAVGDPVGDLTDAIGLTGSDAVYDYDTNAPKGEVLFAGAPARTGAPAPEDIQILDRGEFKIGFSPRLRHPVWCAYHVTKDAKFVTDRRNFARDKSVPAAPKPSDYERSGYDRGHMAPNHAIVSRYGEEAQKKTFLMSNIAPQTPALNRGVWRNIEHRIADLWTARYGEIWVIVGCISSPGAHEAVSGTDIDVPTAYYQIIVAQEGLDVRAVAVLFPQTVGWRDYPTRYIVSIDELEARTGLDFLPDLPYFIQAPLEAHVPTRLWPIRFFDIFKLIALRCVN